MTSTNADAERRAAAIALGVGVALMLLKFAAYYRTGSAAVFSDALESIVNVLASGFALWAIAYAHRPADDAHPYGHGKIEFLAAGLEASMVALAGVVIVFRAIESWATGATVDDLGVGLILLSVAMTVNGGVGLWLLRRGRRTGSLVLEADGRHLLTDAVTSAAVLAALVVIALTGWSWVDPVAAIVVGLYVGWTAVGLLRRSVAGLMDEQDPADDAALRALLDRHASGEATPLVCSYHKLRHRHVGRFHWVDVHLVVPRDWDVDRGHRVASAIEREVERLLGDADATAHVEPCLRGECGRCTPLVPSPGTPGEG